MADQEGASTDALLLTNDTHFGDATIDVDVYPAGEAAGVGAHQSGRARAGWRSNMTQTKKIRVGVLFGGRSSEHEISLRSALTVMSAMDPARYEVVPIGIGRDGRWYWRADAILMLAEAAPRLEALAGGGIEVSLLPHPAANALVEAPAGAPSAVAASAPGAGKLPGPLDVVFPVLHGSYGEDGTVQGLFELASVPSSP